MAKTQNETRPDVCYQLMQENYIRKVCGLTFDESTQANIWSEESGEDDLLAVCHSL